VYPAGVGRVSGSLGPFVVAVAVALALALAVGGSARADRSADLAAAGRLLAAGAWDRAEALVAPLTQDPSLLLAERAEAFRIHGLALFFQDRRAEAEESLRRYLELEPDAHLDPALYPPEAVVFLEDVRTRSTRPPPKRRRSAALNLLPPLGQIQNGDRPKAWIIGVAEVGLLAVNVTTYAMLTSSCRDDRTCERDPGQARALRTTNLVSGALLVAVWAVGVTDGFLGYRRALERDRGWRLSVVPTGSGAAVGAAASF
jgi:hypothetical protein